MTNDRSIASETPTVEAELEAYGGSGRGALRVGSGDACRLIVDDTWDRPASPRLMDD